MLSLAGESLLVYTDFKSTWSITGDAARLLTPDGATVATMGEGTEVSVKTIKVGQAVVKATVVRDPAYTAQSTITVGDSSVIAKIQVWYIPSNIATLSAGDSSWFDGILSDAQQRFWWGRPAAWWSSDTNVATISRERHHMSGFGGRVRARSPGRAWIVAKFRTVRDSMEITVTP